MLGIGTVQSEPGSLRLVHSPRWYIAKERQGAHAATAMENAAVITDRSSKKRPAKVVPTAALKAIDSPWK